MVLRNLFKFYVYSYNYKTIAANRYLLELINSNSMSVLTHLMNSLSVYFRVHHLWMRSSIACIFSFKESFKIDLSHWLKCSPVCNAERYTSPVFPIKSYSQYLLTACYRWADTCWLISGFCYCFLADICNSISDILQWRMHEGGVLTILCHAIGVSPTPQNQSRA